MEEKKLALLIGKNSKSLKRAALKYANLNYDILLIAQNIDIHAEVKFIRKCGFKCHCIDTNFNSEKSIESLLESILEIDQPIGLVLIYQNLSEDLLLEDKLAKSLISKLGINGEGKLIMAQDRKQSGPFISKELIVRAFVNGIFIEGANY